ncbi:MAG: methyltransferase domain-containing protein [Planctomycetota bacterium]|nr:methyltransferase domain-containing protein [Planctomycetota bacterium]
MLEFITQSIKNFRHTGAICPSGRFLAREMTRSIRERPGRRRVLEVGPGTGPFTRRILAELRPGDELDIVEINSAFCEQIERRLLKPFRRRNPGITVRLHQCPIESAALGSDYDHIVCGLPFNNFEPPLVRRIFRRMLDLLDENGDLVYFEYAAVRRMKAPLAKSKVRAGLRRIEAHGRSMVRRHGGRRHLVVGNIPPAVAIRLHRASA